MVGRVQCHGLSNVIRCDFIEAACILEEDHYLHEVEDEVRRADECPGPKVADPHGVGVGLHGAADVGGAAEDFLELVQTLRASNYDLLLHEFFFLRISWHLWIWGFGSKLEFPNLNFHTFVLFTELVSSLLLNFRSVFQIFY